MSKLETLIEQTSFLLEKQEVAKKECKDIFSDFIAMVEKRTQGCKNAEDARSLEKIHDLIIEQSKRFDEETQEDIDFLSEQLKMLGQVQKISDKEKAKEIMAMVVDEDEELLDTDEFKRNVIEEGELSKQNLLTMIEDIKEALDEGSVKEVELLLESFALDQGDLDEEECEDGDCSCGECGDEEDDDCSCCSRSKNGSSCCKQGSEEEVDIFAEFNKYADGADNKGKKNK